MRRKQLLSGALALVLAGCASVPPSYPTAAYSETGYPIYEPNVYDSTGQSITTAVSAPFYALFKGVACVATLVVAGPVAAGSALTDRADRFEVRRSLDQGVARNCT